MTSHRNFFAFVLLVCLTAAPILAQDKSPSPAASASHVGTWKLVSTKYGEAKEHSPFRDVRIKIINPTHFTWMQVDESKKIVASAAGKYTLNNEAYVETIDFAGEGMDAYLGKPQKFTLRIEGDKLRQSGELSDGLKIEEVWERVK